MLSQGRISLRGLSEVADGTPISLANTTVHCIRQTYTVGWDILLQNVILGRCMGSLRRCGHWREGVVTERGCGYPGEGVVTRERVWWSYTFLQNLLHVLYKCRVIHVSFLMYGVLAHTLIEFGFLLL